MKIYKYRATRVRKHHNKRKWFAPKIILKRDKGVMLPLDTESIEEEIKLWEKLNGTR